jgi:hypothetical protein
VAAAAAEAAAAVDTVAAADTAASSRIGRRTMDSRGGRTHGLVAPPDRVARNVTKSSN